MVAVSSVSICFNLGCFALIAISLVMNIVETRNGYSDYHKKSNLPIIIYIWIVKEEECVWKVTKKKKNIKFNNYKI